MKWLDTRIARLGGRALLVALLSVLTAAGLVPVECGASLLDGLRAVVA